MNIHQKKYFLLLAFSFSILAAAPALAQQNNPPQQMKKRFGLKAGANFPVSKLTSVNKAVENNTGFMVGGFFAYPSKGIGYRSELIFSRQGYDYKSSTQTGSVKLDYIVVPQLMTFNITRFFQLQAGGQLAFLLNARVDSSANPSSIPYTGKAKDFFNKINYGFAGGLEISPLAGLSVGGRYNLFFNVMDNAQQYPAYIPDKKNLRNGLVQLYLSYSF